MRQPVGGVLIEDAVLDVLAQNAGTILIAAAEETTAIMIVADGSALGLVLMLRHDGCSP